MRGSLQLTNGLLLKQCLCAKVGCVHWWPSFRHWHLRISSHALGRAHLQHSADWLSVRSIGCDAAGSKSIAHC